MEGGGMRGCDMTVYITSGITKACCERVAYESVLVLVYLIGVPLPNGDAEEANPCNKYGATLPLNTNFKVSPWFVANGETDTGNAVCSGGIRARARFSPCVSFHPTQVVTNATPSLPSPVSLLGQEGWV